MNPCLKNDWLRALRSGRYKQCRGYMHVGDAFDPFGVLHDLLCTRWVSCGRFGDDNEIFAADGRKTQWPGWEKLMDWHISEQAANEIMTMSDGGRTFDEVADWIERNIPVVVYA